MSPLQQRLIEDLQLRGMSARTQQMYVRAVRQLAQHYSQAARSDQRRSNARAVRVGRRLAFFSGHPKLSA
jgi:hypothetical protein